MQVIEPQFQRDFISLLPKEVANYCSSMHNYYIIFDKTCIVRIVDMFVVNC